MSVKINSFKYNSITPTGWISEEIKFGKEFTVLLGENGSGKTPMMWGIAYALGYPLELATEITTNVASTSIDLIVGTNNYTINRYLSEKFKIDICKFEKDFTSQTEFSSFFFDLLGIKTTGLSPKKGEKAAHPSISTFLPLIWVSQSKGWTYLYQPLAHHQFIKTQQEEMIRLLLDIPPKYPFDVKKTYEEKKAEVVLLNNRITLARENLKNFKKEIGKAAKIKITDIEEQKTETRNLIEQTRQQLIRSQQSTTDIDATIDNQKGRIQSLRSEISNLTSKKDSLETAFNELDGDAEILEYNEVATDEFRNICGVEGCKIFESARKMYGKRLLYLRDQLKDIKNSTNSLTVMIEELKSIEADEQSNLKLLEVSRDKILSSKGTDELFKLIEQSSSKFLDLDEKFRNLKSLEKLETTIGSLLTQKYALEEIVKNLRPKGKKDTTRLHDVLAYFKKSFNSWLKVLNTPNIKSADVDDSFNVIINGQEFTEDSSQDGSTRARIVLAYFASLLETAITQSNKHPGFLFLDTPRQHELHLPDLKKYFVELRTLISKTNCQIVIACKDEIFELQPHDKSYQPIFKFDNETRYLGPKGLMIK